jgi:hypothetical protein
MERCECCGQVKPSVRPHGYIRDMTGYQVPTGQRSKFPMSADMCDECFEQAQIRRTKAYEWFEEKKRPPIDRLP